MGRLLRIGPDPLPDFLIAIVAVKIEVPFWMVLLLATHDHPIGFDFPVFSNGRFAVAPDSVSGGSFTHAQANARNRTSSNAGDVPSQCLDRQGVWRGCPRDVSLGHTS